MAGLKKKYVAKVGLNFSKLDDLRVEQGEVIPDKIDQKTIDVLLKNGDIEEVKEEKK